MSDAINSNHQMLLREALEKRDFPRVRLLAEQVFERFKSDKSSAAEGALAYYACMLYEHNFPDVYKFLHAFIEQFPSSYHLVRLYRADFLRQAGSPDYATDDARVYLRNLKDTGMFSKLDTHQMICFGVTKAFLLLVTVYALLGARTYSRRTLKGALSLPLNEGHDVIQREYGRLKQELRYPEHKELDQKWETFFNGGQGATELIELAEEHNCSLLAKRIKLLEEKFRSFPDYKVGPDEVLQLVSYTHDKSGREIISLS